MIESPDDDRHERAKSLLLIESVPQPFVAHAIRLEAVTFGTLKRRVEQPLRSARRGAHVRDERRKEGLHQANAGMRARLLLQDALAVRG